MPNYCENDLTVYGDPADIKKLIDFIASVDDADKSPTVFDFNKVFPYPEQYRLQDAKAHQFEIELRSVPRDDPELDAKVVAIYSKYQVEPGRYMHDGYNSGGYEWCCQNWGTKWNACRPTLEDWSETASKAIFHFDTAWSPPIPVIQKLAELFPSLEFSHEYYEQGMAYCGSSWYRNGKCEKETQGAYYGTRGG